MAPNAVAMAPNAVAMAPNVGWDSWTFTLITV